jgi:hypothetical protein
MGFAGSLVKGLRDRVLKRYGERLVSNLADTSADAPSNFASPKRDLYDQLKADGRLDEARKDR